MQIRPGTDGALALAMINVIISEELYQRDFVEKYTYGFDKLVSHVEQYTPEWAEPLTNIKAKDIYGGESFWSDPLQISLPKSKEQHRFWFLSFLLDILSERNLNIPPFISFLSMN